MSATESGREGGPVPLTDGAICEACGHPGRLHYRDAGLAKSDGCMARVDSAWTVTNDRACGCHRRRA